MGLMIRLLIPPDRVAVEDMLQTCGNFTAEEICVALEVFDEGVPSGADGPYIHFGVEIEGTVRGYVSIGKTPMTTSTWHLYWLCVHPRVQKSGVGRALQLHAEEYIRTRGGTRLVLETSGQPSY